MLAAVILAAGESRLMGKPKALLSLQGRTFVERLIEATRHPRVGITRVVLGADADGIRAKLPAMEPASIVVNPDWRMGQLSSIHAAIRSLPAAAGLPAETTEGLILCPVDHPLISANLVARLIGEFDSCGKQIVLPVHRGRRGHPVIFRATLYEELLAASPEIGARQVVWAHAKDVEEVPTEEEAVILNLNDPEALHQATQKL
ncbi:MAG: nucleotidyltransferase family protein [Candidatus Acidiferrales bacterium]